MTTGLAIEGLVLRLAGRAILDEVWLMVPPGACAAVIGRTGCGKSLLVRALCGLYPSTGTVQVAGVSSQTHGWNQVRAALGVLLAVPGLLDDLTVVDNVAWRLRRQHMAEDRVRLQVTEILDEFGMGAAANKLPSELSGGMRRRAALARALVHRPAGLLLDDPTAGLDPVTARSVMDFILGAAKTRRTSVILTTHDLGQVARRADQVWLLAHQRLRLLDPPAESWRAELCA
jgi:phospholipid/cholesterol/gamma-HCH transport system ATP-binding protein